MHYLAPILVGAATGVADAGARLLENQPVGLTTAITMASFVGAAMIWIQRKFESRDRALALNNKEISDALVRANTELHERLARMEQRIADLPCDKRNKSGECD